MKEHAHKLVAPDIDRLLRFFDRGFLNPSGLTPELNGAMRPLFAALSPLAPLKSNNEAKSIWIRVPRGDISDYDSFDDLKDCGEVETHEEYESRWKEDYPDEIKWYELVIVEGKTRNGEVTFRAVALDGKSIINARTDEEGGEQYSDDAAIALCALLVPAVQESLALLKNGEYNNMVSTSLPYRFRTGVIRRSVLWKHHPEYKKDDFDNLPEKTVSAFRALLSAGKNDPSAVGRMQSFTANDFFRACAAGYAACGYETAGKSPAELYRQYADGRDEGLTGKGMGLNAGPGIDFDDASAWDAWYSSDRFGGHPWEVVRGGNSTHVDLYVCHDEQKPGYYFAVAGKHRPFEAIHFYLALAGAGLPVILHAAEEILARFDGSDYVGIVPHATIPKYCEGMFPKEYGRVIDFMHVYEEDMQRYGNDIQWLPEPPATLCPA